MCAEWQNTLPPQLLMSSTAGECGMTEGPHSTKLPQSWDIGSDQSDVPATFGVGDVKSFWPVVSLAVCASC